MPATHRQKKRVFQHNKRQPGRALCNEYLKYQQSKPAICWLMKVYSVPGANSLRNIRPKPQNPHVLTAGSTGLSSSWSQTNGQKTRAMYGYHHNLLLDYLHQQFEIISIRIYGSALWHLRLHDIIQLRRKVFAQKQGKVCLKHPMYVNRVAMFKRASLLQRNFTKLFQIT